MNFQTHARRLLSNRYLIVPLHPGQKRPQGAAWQHARVSAIDVPRLWSNGAGVGVLCGVGALPVYAVDIDVYDETIAARLERWCEQHLGVTAVRVGRAPKRLLLYQGREAGWTKRTSANWVSADGTAHHVEVLGSGQQFVAHGIHPDTQLEYDWIDCWGGIGEWEAAALPVLESDGVVALIAEFERLAYGEGWRIKSGAGSKGLAAGPAEHTRVPKENSAARDGQGGDTDALLTPTSVGKSIEEIKAALAQLDPDMQREDWIRIIAAVKHEVTAMPATGWPAGGWPAGGWPAGGGLAEWQSDRARAGFDAVLEWSARGSKFAGSGDVIGRWRSFKRSEGVTWPWVEALAAGGDVVEASDGLVAPARMKRPKTEMGNAERLLDRFGDGLMCVPELKRWYVWNSVYWRKAMDVEVEHLAKSTIMGLREEVDLWGEDEREAFFKFCATSQRAVMVANMVRLASSDPRVVVPASELDKDWWALGVRNGVVDLRSGECAPPDAQRRVTLVAGCGFDATARNVLWESTVADVFDDDVEMVAFFQRLVGYTLLGRPEEDALVIPWGSGSNGKSTLLGVLSKVFGDYCKVGSADTFLSAGPTAGGMGAGSGPRPDLLAMRGARLVWVGEPDQGAELREGFVKSATGGDPITARAMHSNEIVTIQPSWVLWMPTNHRPIVRGDDWAMWRRLLPVPFNRDFDHDPLVAKDAQRDKRLVETEAAMAGVLNWCIAGARAYLEHGLKRPHAVNAARDAYREDMDLLAEWLAECCQTGPDFHESGARLWGSWEMFARSRGELRMIPSQRSLTRRLEARGFEYSKHSAGRNIRGFYKIRVNPSIELGGIADARLA